ncbi:hypothetical protein GCM10011363_27160 [Marivita lacus]|uniref:Uncharacterized protein n=1 Tax=Marivita lacus TaxID=1323742 RepID=A0ABQ1KS13_9RHOB|nr:hypothetical protein GCM10011363_27160 [Marivita lacus]
MQVSARSEGWRAGRAATLDSIAFISATTVMWQSSGSLPGAFRKTPAASRNTPTISCSGSTPRSIMAKSRDWQIVSAAAQAASFGSLMVDVTVG